MAACRCVGSVLIGRRRARAPCAGRGARFRRRSPRSKAVRCSPIGARHGIDPGGGFRLAGGRRRWVPEPFGFGALDPRAAISLLRRDVARRAVRGSRPTSGRPWRSRGDGRPATVVCVCSRDDAAAVAGPHRLLDGLLSMSGHGGVGLDVDQVMDEHVDERVGQDAADPVDVDRADPDDLAGLVRGGVPAFEGDPVDQHAHVHLEPIRSHLQQRDQLRVRLGPGRLGRLDVGDRRSARIGGRSGRRRGRGGAGWTRLGRPGHGGRSGGHVVGLGCGAAVPVVVDPGGGCAVPGRAGGPSGGWRSASRAGGPQRRLALRFAVDRHGRRVEGWLDTGQGVSRWGGWFSG